MSSVVTQMDWRSLDEGSPDRDKEFVWRSKSGLWRTGFGWTKKQFWDTTVYDPLQPEAKTSTKRIVYWAYLPDLPDGPL